MAITPADIESLTFTESKKGYDTEEVDAFLDQVSGEIDAMLSKIADLKGRLNTSEQQLAAAQAQISQLKEQPAGGSTQLAPVASATPVMTATEQQISQVLIVAQQSADRLVADARADADSIRTEADQKAREVIRQALAEKQAELDEIDRLKQSREDFRSEYKRLLQHFIDDADAVFPQMSLNIPNGSTVGHSEIKQPVMASRPDTSAPVLPTGAGSSINALDGFDDLD